MSVTPPLIKRLPEAVFEHPISRRTQGKAYIQRASSIIIVRSPTLQVVGNVGVGNACLPVAAVRRGRSARAAEVDTATAHAVLVPGVSADAVDLAVILLARCCESGI